ncbi:MAG TPA: hypothetical protein DCE03_05075 [Synergistaceae bacterium]|nr:MAG: Uncharacterized protein XD80_1003 [Synergistales bacterium 53_16]KUL01892.1 MAG: Uncharacterized protein XE12_0938 [Synergistales bacterium 54_9]MDK2846449.1 hypothetical protein [Synergistales bacterium]HAA47841.1 hypothetical protein [Synergistaceae bacterium]MDN5335281.1 hypothetical protein [Synergistales bacterium]
MSRKKNERPEGNERNGEKEITVGDLLRVMSGPTQPPFIVKLVSVVQDWMASALYPDSGSQPDDFFQSYSDRRLADPEALFGQLEWMERYADLLPAPYEPAGHEDVVVLCVGTVDFDEGMRMTVDHAALFGRETCKRVWIVSDSWIIGEVARYVQHIRALEAYGVQLRFLLVTPWGWVEIPLGAERTERGFYRNDGWSKDSNNTLRFKRRDEG